MTREDMLVFKDLMREVVNEEILPSIIKLEGRMDRLEVGITRLEERMDNLEELITRLEERINKLEELIARLEEQVNKLEERITKLEEQVNKLEEIINNDVLPRLTKVECMMNNDMLPKLNVIIEGEDLLLTKYEFNIRISKVELEVQKITPIINIISRHSEMLSKIS